MSVKQIYKEKALQFLKEFNVSELSLDRLLEVFSAQGYKLIRYNTFEPCTSTDELLKELNLTEYSQSTTAFTFKDGNIKIIFIDDTLLDNEKLYALAHEEGHIYCGHMDRYSCSCTSVEDEKEANEFAHYILDPPSSYKIEWYCKTHFKQLLIIACVIMLFASIPIMTIRVERAKLDASQEYVKTVDYYITENGTKYHIEGCRFIKDKDNIRKLTEEEFQSGRYDPCKECIK